MAIRTVAVFHCTSGVQSAWSCAEGMVRTFAALGFDTIDCGNPLRSEVAIERLRDVDLIVLMAPEWYHHGLTQRYGDAWQRLPAAKVAWYAESFHRDDRDFDFAAVKDLADIHYFPARQDAQEFGGHWLPFGVDTEIFYPKPVPKRFDVAFLGQLYAKRLEYVQRITVPITHIQSVSDPDPALSFAKLAEAYSMVRIFVNLPAYSRLLVTKVTEVMACRTLLITPEIDHPSGAGNLKQFSHGRTLLYYPPDRPETIGDLVAEVLSTPGTLERMSEDGFRDVHDHHSLTVRVSRILKDVAADALHRLPRSA